MTSNNFDAVGFDERSVDIVLRDYVHAFFSLMAATDGSSITYFESSFEKIRKETKCVRKVAKPLNGRNYPQYVISFRPHPALA